MRWLVGSLLIWAVLSVQTTGLAQRSDGVPHCEGLVEEVGDRAKLPPWAIGWTMPEGGFVSVFRFHRRDQAEKCSRGKDYAVRWWDKANGAWRTP